MPHISMIQNENKLVSNYAIIINYQQTYHILYLFVSV
jgi:hypothetical protein